MGVRDGLVEMSFVDEGIPYNPLDHEDSDTSLSLEERPIDGLGIYLMKDTMDEAAYSYREGRNVLTMIKAL